MKAVIISTIVGLLTLFYLNTAVVIGEGGGSSVLVLRPFHGLSPFYGGGEEASWRRAHPNQPDPWWHTGSFACLASFDDEAAISAFGLTYELGYYITVLSLMGFIPYFLARNILPKARSA